MQSRGQSRFDGSKHCEQAPWFIAADSSMGEGATFTVWLPAGAGNG
ncbi:MAG TPA: hypothetical protein VK508_19745 [Cyclobacteriaceae bacterium]|nr:hypothetical protein [Cyclobacteriaceae bacterium]